MMMGMLMGSFMELIPPAELDRGGEIKLKKSGLKVGLWRKLPYATWDTQRTSGRVGQSLVSLSASLSVLLSIRATNLFN